MTKIGNLILKLVRNIILAFCYIYGFNFLGAGLNIFIPINIVTVGVITFLGLPGLLAFIGLFFVLK